MRRLTNLVMYTYPTRGSGYQVRRYGRYGTHWGGQTVEDDGTVTAKREAGRGPRGGGRKGYVLWMEHGALRGMMAEWCGTTWTHA